MAVSGKKVTWERADMALLAIIDLMECEDLRAHGGEFMLLDRVAHAVRAIRAQCPEPEGTPRSLTAFADYANAIEARPVRTGTWRFTTRSAAAAEAIAAQYGGTVHVVEPEA